MAKLEKKRGLTLGKYAPLHRGHQMVIETGLSEMDEMIVIIYDAPETTVIPLAVRSGWIRSLYPKVRVIEAWDGPTEIGYTAELMRSHERYVIDTLGVNVRNDTSGCPRLNILGIQKQIAKHKAYMVSLIQFFL